MTMRNIYQPPRNSHGNFQKFDEMAKNHDEMAAEPFFGWKKRDGGWAFRTKAPDGGSPKGTRQPESSPRFFHPKTAPAAVSSRFSAISSNFWKFSWEFRAG